MALSTTYGFLLIVCLMAMLMQLTVAKKQVVHIAFAIFCGSIAMMAAQVISADALGKYSVLFGLGACATCNGYWLVARALFRKQNPIGLQHLAYAGLLAVLVVSYRSIGIAEQFWMVDLSAMVATTAVLSEVIGLLSSSVILLTVWEGVRGWEDCNSGEKKQRILFLSVQGAAILSTVIVATALSSATGANIKAWFIPFAASSIIIMTQVLLFWRTFESSELGDTSKQHFAKEELSKEECSKEHYSKELYSNQHFSKQQSTSKSGDTVKKANIVTDPEHALQLADTQQDMDYQLAEQLDELLIVQQLFLQPNLKVADVARTLNVSEYRISRTLKHHFKADNFNRLVNQLRVEHAKQLLLEKDKAHWPVLVVGLESGFASVGPFTRAFKEINGCTPGIFRKQQLSEAAA